MQKTAVLPPDPMESPDVHLAPRPAARKCLNCSGAFVSEWSGHRICGNCKKSQVWRTALDGGRTGKG